MRHFSTIVFIVTGNMFAFPFVVLLIHVPAVSFVIRLDLFIVIGNMFALFLLFYEYISFGSLGID